MGDAAHAMPIVSSEGADHAIQDALDLSDVLDEYSIGAFTKERASVESEYAESASEERLTAMILKFYETKHPGREAASSWKNLGENAEKISATMHNP